jgi:Fe-S cluster assembly protein SufD
MNGSRNITVSGDGLAARWAAALGSAESGGSPAWLRELREQAAGEFRASGLPHRKVEAWKYTPMRALDDYELGPAAPDLAATEPFESPEPSTFKAPPARSRR